MKIFKVQIETTSAAFYPDWETEVCRILRKLAAELEDGNFTSGPLLLFDTNGNKVGTVWYDSLIHREE